MGQIIESLRYFSLKIRGFFYYRLLKVLTIFRKNALMTVDRQGRNPLK